MENSTNKDIDQAIDYCSDITSSYYSYFTQHEIDGHINNLINKSEKIRSILTHLQDENISEEQQLKNYILVDIVFATQTIPNDKELGNKIRILTNRLLKQIK